MRSTARLCNVEPKTVLNILVLASEKCERLLGRKIRNVPMKDVQADEIWSFVGKKEKQVQPGDDPNLGDAYTSAGNSAGIGLQHWQYNVLYMPTTDHDLLQAALAGYLHHLGEIDQRIAELRARLGGTAIAAVAPLKRHTMSAAGRRKVAAAQKKRWAAVKQAKAEPAKPRRKMSAAARKRIGDAARKRWAVVKAKQKGKPVQ